MELFGDLKLGALLVELGLVQKDWIGRALQISKLTGLPLGKSLILLDCITQEELKAAVEVQSLLRDSLIDISSAKAALDIVKRLKSPLADALVLMGMDREFSRDTRLGDLLVDSRHIDSEQIDLALNVVDSSGLPLGRILILLNCTSPSTVDAALSLQKQIRSGRLTRQRAVHLLETHNLKEHLLDSKRQDQFIRFGELFMISSVLSKEEIDSALTNADNRGKMLGQILLEQEKISEQMLVAALRLQDLVWKKKITVAQAAEALCNLSRCGLNIHESFAQIGLEYNCLERQLSLADFLRIAGYINDNTVQEMIDVARRDQRFNHRIRWASRWQRPRRADLGAAVKVSLRSREILIDLLNATNSADKELIDSAIAVHDLVRNGRMKIDQALLNLSLCNLIRDAEKKKSPALAKVAS